MLIIAHRGASRLVPENTKAAFLKAVKMNVDMIEFDIQKTKDNKIIVFHDKKLDRITKKKGDVGDYNLKELKKLDIGSWFNNKFNKERILTLEQALNVIKKTKLNVEVKEEMEGFEEQILKTIKKHKKRILLSSFNHNILKKIRRLDKNIKIGLLLKKPTRNYIKLASEIGAYSIHFRSLIIRKRSIEKAHKNGFKAYVWVVDDKSKMRKLIESKIDGIFTNNVATLKEVLNEMHKS